MRKKVLVYGLCLLGSICTLSAKDKKDVALYKDPKAPIEKRVNDLLSRMTLEEKVMQLNQYTLGRNNNVNNVGEEVKKVPAEIGSLIYFETNPALRNSMQKKAMEESGYSYYFRLRCNSWFPYRVSYFVGTGLFLESGFGRAGVCCICTGSAYVGSGLDFLTDD